MQLEGEGTINGNLEVIGIGRRILSDFNANIIADRTLFQTSNANELTSVGLIPNGTNQQSDLTLFNNSNPANASTTELRISDLVSTVAAARKGSGSYLPLTFNVGGAESSRILTDGKHLIGTTTDDGSNALLQVNGNLSLQGNGRRIRGLFGGASIDNAVLFQRSDANTSSQIGVIPNGTGTASYITAINNSTPSNGSNIFIGITASIATVSSSRFGAASYLPLTFQTSDTERMRILAAGPVIVGGTADDGTSGLLQVHFTSNSRGLSLNGTNAGSDVGIGLKNTTRAWSFAVRGSLADAIYLRDVTGNADRYYWETGSGANTGYTVAGRITARTGGICLLLGADADSIALTDATNKVARIGTAHYTNSEEPVGILFASNTSTNNSLLIGGGSSVFNATTDIRFHTALTNTTTGGTERLRINGFGRILIGTTTDAGELLQVAGTTRLQHGQLTLLLGADSGNTSLTDATLKNSRIAVAHYLNAEEPVCLIHAGSDVGANYINIGGGTTICNAASLITFNTAANTTTVTGTEVMRLNASQRVLIGNPTDNALDKVQVVGGMMLRSSGFCLRLGADSAGGDAITDATSKIARIVAHHYTNSEEPVCMMMCNPLVGSNLVYIGGGGSTMNAATGIVFYTGATTTTTTGSEAGRFDASGNFLVGTTNATGKIQVAGDQAPLIALWRRNNGVNGFHSILQFAKDDSTSARAIAGSIQAGLSDTTNGAHSGYLVLYTASGGAESERLRISNVGFMSLTGSLGRGTPAIVGSATSGVADTVTSIICSFAGTVTLTLPSASAFIGRELYIKTTTANTVVSASSNVTPLAGGAAGTAILAATAGRWAKLVSDGTNWIIMAAN